MKYKGYIYCIRNKINNKKYIGQTSEKRGYNHRIHKHKNQLINNKHYSKNLQYEFNKFGIGLADYFRLLKYNIIFFLLFTFTLLLLTYVFRQRIIKKSIDWHGKILY